MADARIAGPAAAADPGAIAGGVGQALAHDSAAKHVSGAAAYANGRICITLTPIGLALKLPEDARARLENKGARPLRYFPNGPIKKDYILLPKSYREDRRKLATWARKSIDHVLTLPKPKKR